jgi:putative ABC transport system permease protein
MRLREGRVTAPSVPIPDRSAPSASGGQVSLVLRLAVRELRAGIIGFRVFLACIALGVMAIAGVSSSVQSLTDALARDGGTILGGDADFSLMHREASARERALLAGNGEVSVAATMRAMARAADGRAGLVEVKAVDAAYPLYGRVEIDPPGRLAEALAARAGIYGAAADEALFARLDLKAGDRLAIGDAQVEIRAVLKSEPDKLAGGIGFGPRLILSEEALHASGLLQPGSLVRWHYRLRINAAQGGGHAADAVAQAIEAALPDAGWNVRTRSHASPQLERNIERFTQFLTLVGLTALLVGGIGVANAVKGHLERKRQVIATMKSLGATGGRVFAIYLAQVMALALIGGAIGLAAGAALPFLVAWAFGAVVPLPLEPALEPKGLALALIYGLVTALAFALWPLGRIHDVAAASLFRDEVAPQRRFPRARYMLATMGAVALLAVLAVLLAYDRRIATIFVGSAAAVFLGLRLVATLVMLAARYAPRPRSTVLRLAIANIHRPGALTPTVVLSLGLGLAVLVTVALIEGNLRHQLGAALPERAPAFYFLDIPASDGDRFAAFVRAHAPSAALERVPMLRGRIVSAKGIKAEDLKPAANASWVLQSDRGITYAEDVPLGSHVVAGTWWTKDQPGPPLVSMEKRIADGLGLAVGDEIVVNVLGRNVSARIANLRALDWQSLGINFVLVYSPASFRGAPHTDLATLTYPQGSTAEEEAALVRAAAAAFPAVTTVRVKDALETLAGLVSKLVLAIRSASLITILAAILVLGGALAAGHRHRVYDAVVLKTLGATRARLVAAYALEYVLLGLATGLFGVTAGSIAAALIVTRVMNFTFLWLPGSALLAALAALGLTLVFGLAGTIAALGQKPAPVLRNL